MKPRDLVLMFSSVLVASLVLRQFPALKNFVAANSITVKDASGTPLFDAI